MKKNRDNEFALIAKIKEGDTSKFRILIDEYKDVSFSLACSILKNEQDAEDALQESFIKAFKGLKHFSFKSSFSTWLYKIVLNVCFTKAKKQKPYSQWMDVDSYLNVELTENKTPFELMILSERKLLVNSVLKKMKKEESLLLRLFYLAELSIDEIKQITGFKESKIKVTLHRARRSFQQRLEKMYGTEITMSL